MHNKGIERDAVIAAFCFQFSPYTAPLMPDVEAVEKVQKSLERRQLTLIKSYEDGLARRKGEWQDTRSMIISRASSSR